MSDEIIESFTVDLSKPPYEVPCPECFAFALEACRSKPKACSMNVGISFLTGLPTNVSSYVWPKEARVIAHAHEARAKHWDAHPEFRVKAIL